MFLDPVDPPLYIAGTRDVGASFADQDLLKTSLYPVLKREGLRETLQADLLIKLGFLSDARFIGLGIVLVHIVP